MRRLYPEQWKVDGYGRLLVNAVTLDRVKRGDAAEEIVRSWTIRSMSFGVGGRRLLLYQCVAAMRSVPKRGSRVNEATDNDESDER